MIGKLCFFLTPFLLVILRVFAFGPVAHAIPPTAVLLSAITYIFMTSLFCFAISLGSMGRALSSISTGLCLLRDSCWANNWPWPSSAVLSFSCSISLSGNLNPLSWETLLFVLLAFATVLVGVLGLGTLISIRFPTPRWNLNQTRYRQSATPVLLAFEMLSLLLALPPLWLNF